jgi:hypothetical protein
MMPFGTFAQRFVQIPWNIFYLERGHRIVLVMVAVLQYISMILSARQLETS